MESYKGRSSELDSIYSVSCIVLRTAQDLVVGNPRVDSEGRKKGKLKIERSFDGASVSGIAWAALAPASLITTRLASRRRW